MKKKAIIKRDKVIEKLKTIASLKKSSWEKNAIKRQKKLNNKK